MLNKNCTEPYLGPLHTVYKLFILIKIIVQFFECKIPERVLLMFSKASHLCEAKMCGLSLLAIFTLWVFTLWHKRKSSITSCQNLSPSEGDSTLLTAFLLNYCFLLLLVFLFSFFFFFFCFFIYQEFIPFKFFILGACKVWTNSNNVTAPGGGGLRYETDGDARRKFWI